MAVGDALNEHSGVAGKDWRCHCGPIYRRAVSGGATGRKPARIASVTGLVDRSRRYHEVSILIAAGGGPRRGFGWQPLAKGSVTIMRPPQQRHGPGRARGSAAAGGWGGPAGFARDGTRAH